MQGAREALGEFVAGVAEHNERLVAESGFHAHPTSDSDGGSDSAEDSQDSEVDYAGTIQQSTQRRPVANEQQLLAAIEAERDPVKLIKLHLELYRCESERQGDQRKFQLQAECANRLAPIVNRVQLHHVGFRVEDELHDHCHDHDDHDHHHHDHGIVEVKAKKKNKKKKKKKKTNSSNNDNGDENKHNDDGVERIRQSMEELNVVADHGDDDSQQAVDNSDNMSNNTNTKRKKNKKKKKKKKKRNNNNNNNNNNTDNDDKPGAGATAMVARQEQEEQSDESQELLQIFPRGTAHTDIQVVSVFTMPHIAYQNIYKSPEYVFGMFIMPKGTSIPLHDHPSMTVVSRVLYGDIKMDVFTLFEDQEDASATYERKEDVVSGKQVANPNPKQTRYGQVYPAEKVSTSTLHKDTPAFFVHPNGPGNVHVLTALTDAVLLDVSVPPYCEEQGRDIRYFKLGKRVKRYRRKGKTVKQESLILTHIPEPDNYMIASAPYTGTR